MNIREHIEAAHYPTDDKGRALVPTPSGTAIILATDMVCGRFPIVAWCAGKAFCFSPDGQWSLDNCVDPYHLLPPPPRKVKVTAWALVSSGQPIDVTNDASRAQRWRDDIERSEIGHCERVVKLTGEYEEPWS